MPDETPTPTQTLSPASTSSSALDQRAVPERPASVWLTRLVVVALVLAAVNLRPAITSLGALFEEVRDGLGMSGSVAGVLTSVPPLCFAVFGVAAPRLARRFGLAAVVCAGMVAITAGLVIRPFAGGTVGFLAASVLTLMGIALSNVLMPVIVKRYFPDRVGSMTGLYSMALALGTSVAAVATVPITSALGGSWRTGLVIWAVLGAVAVLAWAPLAGGRGAAAAPQADAGGTPPKVFRSRTAWALACFFGLQATSAYITMGWLPQIFRDAGVPASTAGLLLAVTMGLGIPLSFVLPNVAARMKNQGPLAAVLGLCGLVAYAGLHFAPVSGAWVWVLLLGVSMCTFPLVLTLIGMRSRTGAGVVRLSTFVQSTGYLIAIPGPLLIGVLYEHSGGWGLPITLMAGLMVPQIVLGILAGRDRTIEDEC
ncbi:CynX/NimT family MFS transporter [Streptomyces sannanensis]|uniref:CynX/NimT family MFS transporter n=1 Tax=Streptomyces sannanensis TaxID=285536 RepID=A0ABP6S7P4_9ACTN